MFKKKFSLLLVAAVLCFIVSCSDDKDKNKEKLEEGTPFSAQVLGLVPGSTTAELNFTWYSSEGGKSLVRVFKENGDFVKVFSGTSGAASDGKRWHKVVVKELAADTKYKYSVSNDSSDWSEKYDYKTPKTNAFKFALVGDPQLTNGNQDATSNWFSSDRTTREGWKTTIGEIAAKGVDFIASAGDQVDKTSGGDETEYSHFFAPTQLRSIPFAPVMGNHDAHVLFEYHYNLPNASSGSDIKKQGNYWYRYNNVLFVVLNTAPYPQSTAEATPFVNDFGTKIDEAKAANTGYDWLIVQHHKSTASVADHLADRDIQYYVEAGFEKLMDNYGVDFVLAGHDHVYARSYVMKAGGNLNAGKYEGGSVVNTAKDNISLAGNPGTMYITVTTASGLKYYELFNGANNLYVQDNEDYPYLVNGLFGSVAYIEGNLPLSNNIYAQNKKPGYAIFDVSGKTITVSVYDVDNSNNTIDKFTVSK